MHFPHALYTHHTLYAYMHINRLFSWMWLSATVCTFLWTKRDGHKFAERDSCLQHLRDQISLSDLLPLLCLFLRPFMSSLLLPASMITLKLSSYAFFWLASFWPTSCRENQLSPHPTLSSSWCLLSSDITCSCSSYAISVSANHDNVTNKGSI